MTTAATHFAARSPAVPVDPPGVPILRLARDVWARLWRDGSHLGPHPINIPPGDYRARPVAVGSARVLWLAIEWPDQADAVVGMPKSQWLAQPGVTLIEPHTEGITVTKSERPDPAPVASVAYAELDPPGDAASPHGSPTAPYRCVRCESEGPPDAGACVPGGWTCRGCIDGDSAAPVVSLGLGFGARGLATPDAAECGSGAPGPAGSIAPETLAAVRAGRAVGGLLTRVQELEAERDRLERDAALYHAAFAHAAMFLAAADDAGPAGCLVHLDRLRAAVKVAEVGISWGRDDAKGGIADA